jgi:hypothetical protein
VPNVELDGDRVRIWFGSDDAPVAVFPPTD